MQVLSTIHVFNFHKKYTKITQICINIKFLKWNVWHRTEFVIILCQNGKDEVNFYLKFSLRLLWILYNFKQADLLQIYVFQMAFHASNAAEFILRRFT
jgi:hypothetical protein